MIRAPEPSTPSESYANLGFEQILYSSAFLFRIQRQLFNYEYENLMVIQTNVTVLRKHSRKSSSRVVSTRTCYQIT